MIWARGEILPDDGLSLPVADRAFEHGLGLFETLRTWAGRPSTLEAHRARMLRSAEALGLFVEPESFPDARAVARLCLTAHRTLSIFCFLFKYVECMIAKAWHYQ